MSHFFCILMNPITNLLGFERHNCPTLKINTSEMVNEYTNHYLYNLPISFFALSYALFAKIFLFTMFQSLFSGASIMQHWDSHLDMTEMDEMYTTAVSRMTLMITKMRAHILPRVYSSFAKSLAIESAPSDQFQAINYYFLY